MYDEHVSWEVSNDSSIRLFYFGKYVGYIKYRKDKEIYVVRDVFSSLNMFEEDLGIAKNKLLDSVKYNIAKFRKMFKIIELEDDVK